MGVEFRQAFQEGCGLLPVPVLAPSALPSIPASVRAALCCRSTWSRTCRSGWFSTSAFAGFFAGTGNLASRFRRLGGTGDTVDITGDNSQDVTDKHVLSELCVSILQRRWCWVHFGITCRTFSLMQYSAGGTRTYEKNSGTRTMHREIRANREVHSLLKFVCCCIAAGVHFTIENPKASSLRQIPQIKALLEQGCAYKYDMDMCPHGLKSPSYAKPFEYYRKPTAILSSFTSLHLLCLRCAGSHLHTSLGRRERFQLLDGT
jgi:hypothetical protein